MDGVATLTATQTPDSESAASFTVVICTHDRPEYLRACLESLGSPSVPLPAGALLVVDSASPAAAAKEIAASTAAHGGRLLRLDRPGLSLARNAGLAAVETPWLAYIDDDARVASDWISAVAHAVMRLPPHAAALGGAIVPHWEAPCPPWWPRDLVPVLTVLDWERPGRVGDGTLPAHVEPYGANMLFRAEALREVGGFPQQLGRVGTKLLSGEEAWVMRALRRSGWEVHYDPAVVVTHSIQAARLTPKWLTTRQYWSGVSEALLAHRLGERIAPKTARMALHAALRVPLAAWPAGSVTLIRQRCALAFALGYVRGAASALAGH